jgi:hypothetical protein
MEANQLVVGEGMAAADVNIKSRIQFRTAAAQSHFTLAGE